VPLRAIVFDFDGVLANSEPLHLRSFQNVLADEGIMLSEHDYYARFLGFDDAGAFAAIADAHGRRWAASHVAELVARKAAQMEILERDTSILFAGARGVVRRASAEVPLAIASGALAAEIRRVLEREGLSTCFAAIVSAEDTLRSKPHPDPYVRAVDALRGVVGADLAAADCVAIEDSHWGLQSARAAGLRTVAVAQTYDRSALTTADLVVDTIADLDLRALARLCAT
jgi:beta-phosphoglucomutase-like phosphatase (HAD superfamily)